MKSLKVLFVVMLGMVLSGCFVKTEYIDRPYPQYVVTTVTENQTKKVEVPKLPIPREEFVKLSAEEQRDVFAYLTVDLAKALKIANDRLEAIVKTLAEKAIVVEQANAKIKQEVLKNDSSKK